MMRLIRRQVRMDEQFEKVFGLNVDDLWIDRIYGIDVARFYEEVLRSPDLSVEEGLLRRIDQARREGVAFQVWDADFAFYVRYLVTGDASKQVVKTDEYATRLLALRGAA